MAITLTSDERIALSRRLVKIPIEDIAFSTAKDNADSSQIIYQNVDDGNKEFFDFYSGIANQYDSEAAAIDGGTRATFDETDVQDSAVQADPNLFFPVSAPFNLFLNPYIVDEVNGVTTSTSTTGERTTITLAASAASPSGNGILQIEDILVNGFNYGTGTDTLAVAYSSGGTAIETTAPLGASVGQYLYLRDASKSCILVVTAVAGVDITVYPLTTFAGTIAIGSTISQAFAGFSAATRRSLSSGAPIQSILDALTTTGSNSLITKVLTWETDLNTELTALTANEDTRTTQTAQIAAAIASVNTALTAINTWQALSNTGAGGKFDDAPLAALISAANTRYTYTTTRLSQISTAVGSVVDNLDGTYTYGTIATDIYYQRYRWLDIRINRALGSLTRSVNSARGANSIQALIDNNDFLYTAYQTVIVATRFADDSTGTNQAEVDNATIFSTGDSCYVVSETVGELAVVIQDIASSILTFNIDIPVGYLKTDLSRIYKIV